MAEKVAIAAEAPVIDHDISQPEETYPEGGLQAWLVVLGAWLALVASLGIMNSLATLQSYVSINQLKDYDEGTIGWIFSLSVFVVFFLGVYIGPIFDKYGPRWLNISGTILLFASLMILSVCTTLWHFILTFGLLTGIACSLLFTPSFAVVGHYFLRRRGLATGLASTGGSIGGIIIPLMLEALFPRIGWTWSIRCLALFCLILCVLACILTRSRLPPAQNATTRPDPRMFFRRENRAFAWTTVGIFLMEFSLFIPLTYITSYARAQGFGADMSYRILPILNAASALGRGVPGYFADRYGAFNMNFIMVLLGAVACLAVWLPSELIFDPVTSTSTSTIQSSSTTAAITAPSSGATAALVIFAILFGFASGSNVSLTPVCVGQLCRTQEYGRYYASCYTVVAFACLIGVPIGGNIVSADGGRYWDVAVCTGLVYLASAASLAVAKGIKVGWSWRTIF